MLKIILVFLFTFSANSEAALYIGGSLGFGSTGTNTAAKYNTTYQSEQESTLSTTRGLFIGYRQGFIAIEAGQLKMPAYYGHDRVNDYPRYKGLPPGTYPQTADITQSITAEAKYVRANFYTPTVHKIEPYFFIGQARTATDNKEWGWYNSTDFVSYANSTETKRMMIGVGVQYAIDHVIVRTEYFRIDDASDNYHTGRRDMRVTEIGVAWVF